MVQVFLHLISVGILDQTKWQAKYTDDMPQLPGTLHAVGTSDMHPESRVAGESVGCFYLETPIYVRFCLLRANSC